MELSLDRPDDFLFIRRADAHSVLVVERDLTVSFILARDRIIDEWGATDAGALAMHHLEPILGLSPDVVLLGTGTRQRFPSQEIMAAFLQRRIGIEVMDNAACARTWNVLAGEGRNVVAAFILP